MLIASLLDNINKLINHVIIYSQISIYSFVLATNSYFINKIEMRLEQSPMTKKKRKYNIHFWGWQPDMARSNHGYSLFGGWKNCIETK